MWDWRWGGALFLVPLSLFPVLALFLVLSVFSREVERSGRGRGSKSVTV